MIGFWIIAAILIAIALGIALYPLFRSVQPASGLDAKTVNLEIFKRQMEELEADLANGALDQQQFTTAKADLERGLLNDVDPLPAPASPSRSGRWATVMIAAGLPLLSVILYQILGTPQALNAAAHTAANTPQEQGQMASMETLVQRLAARMEAQPDNLEGWMMLGRSYMNLQQDAKAVSAFEQAYRLAPKDATVLLALADAMANANGGTFLGRPDELIAQAAELAPDHVNLLWMQGYAAFQRGDLKYTVERWERLYSKLDPKSEEAGNILEYIQEARSQAGLPPSALSDKVTAPSSAATASPTTAPAISPGASSVQVEVTLEPTLAAKASAGDLVFIYAKAASGPPMPLAATRIKVSDLPKRQQLDDSMAVMPQMRLSQFPEILVGARISKSGQATPTSGDLYGEAGPFKASELTAPVQIIINQIKP